MTLSKEQLESEEEREVFYVWPENEASVDAFLKCQTQWNATGMGGVIGLNYSGVDVVLRRYNISHAGVFEDIQTMEFAALKEMNSERK